MLDGWYCRTINEINEQNVNSNNEDDGDINPGDTSDDSIESNDVDYRTQYYGLKRKLKYLLYENEFMNESLRSSQRRLLKVTRDRSFLLDRLLQYEKPDATSSESDGTETSEDDNIKTETIPKKKKIDNPNQPKRKRMSKKQKLHLNSLNMNSEGHMTAEEVEKHLQSRQSLLNLVERAPPTVPNEMLQFSNDPSLEGSESNDQISNLGEESLSVDMNMGQE